MTDIFSLNRLPQISLGEMEALIQKMLKVSLDQAPYIKEEIKTKFLETKLQPSLLKEKIRLGQKIDLTYTDKLFNASLLEIAGNPASNVISKQSKLAAYEKALKDELDELIYLKSQENEVIENYAIFNFKREKVSVGFLEGPSAHNARTKKINKLNRQKFIEAHGDIALAEELDSQIKDNPHAIPEGKERWAKEKKAQAWLDEAAYKKRVGGPFHDTPSLNPKMPQKLEMPKQVFVSLKAKIDFKLEPKMLFTDEAMKITPEARTVMFNPHKSALLSAKNKIVDEIEIEAGRKKSFQSLV